MFIAGVKEKEAKYYITYTKEGGSKEIEYFKKLPKGYYKGTFGSSKGIYYLTRLTNKGTGLIPIRNYKTKEIVKRK